METLTLLQCVKHTANFSKDLQTCTHETACNSLRVVITDKSQFMLPAGRLANKTYLSFLAILPL